MLNLMPLVSSFLKAAGLVGAGGWRWGVGSGGPGGPSAAPVRASPAPSRLGPRRRRLRR